MKTIEINPADYPLEAGEKWFVVHPNDARCRFCIPYRATTMCTKDFLCFKSGILYSVSDMSNLKPGWVKVSSLDSEYEMPEYLFARYFDAQVFIVGPPLKPEELERLKPFDYKPTLPRRQPKQLELFTDSQLTPIYKRASGLDTEVVERGDNK